MALVKFGNGVANISGRIDGTVFSRVRGGAVARGWTKPVNTPTPAQTAARSIFGGNVAVWSGITDKAAWNAAASLLTRFNRLGEPYTPTGRQLAIEVNQNLKSIDVTPPLTVPPADFEAPGGISGLSDSAAEVTAGSITLLDITTISVGPVTNYVIDATPSFPADQKTNFSNLFRRMKYSDQPGISFTTEYIARFGAAATIGDQIAIRLTPIGDNGIAGPSFITVLTLTVPA